MCGPHVKCMACVRGHHSTLLGLTHAGGNAMRDAAACPCTYNICRSIYFLTTQTLDTSAVQSLPNAVIMHL